MEEISRHIQTRINELSNTSAMLKNFIQFNELEKDILNIASYEKAEFCPNDNSIKQLNGIKLDRLSMVHPPAFAFSVKLQLSGHFKVKYKSAITSLPVQIEPFVVTYSGIAIQNDKALEIKNETFDFVRD